MSEIEFYTPGKFLGEDVYLEKGMKFNLSSKIPLFFKIKLPIIYNILVPKAFQYDANSEQDEVDRE